MTDEYVEAVREQFESLINAYFDIVRDDNPALAAARADDVMKYLSVMVTAFTKLSKKERAPLVGMVDEWRIRADIHRQRLH